MSSYAQGVRVEHAVIADLQANGYDTVRAASSKGLADVVAIKTGEVLVISCKRTTMPGPAERADLIRIAHLIPAVGHAIVALKPKGHKHPTYRRLHAAGPKDWTPWTPDQLGDTP